MKVLKAGMEETEKSVQSSTYEIDIYISESFSSEEAESIAVEVIKNYVTKDEVEEKSQLSVYVDSINYKSKRPVIRLEWYGQGEPQILFNRWPK